jgi:hypothetical protein
MSGPAHICSLFSYVVPFRPDTLPLLLPVADFLKDRFHVIKKGTSVLKVPYPIKKKFFETTKYRLSVIISNIITSKHWHFCMINIHRIFNVIILICSKDYQKEKLKICKCKKFK